MTSRRPGRRVPSKSHGMRGPGPRPPMEGPPESVDAETSSGSASGDGGGAETPAGTTAAIRPGSRAANRAAKRAAAGPVRPKSSRSGGGRRSSRGSSTGLILLGVIAVVIVAVAVVVLGNPFGTPTPSSSPVAEATPVASHGDGTCPTSQPASLKAGDVYDVTITTKLGDIVMRIDGALAPIATGNFVALVRCHFYDGIVFHRLMPGFVIQGGDPAGNGSGGPGYAIKDDPVTTTYRRGTVAMARTPAPDSQGSQFFIVLSDDADQSLSGVQYPYAILGEVIEGMDVVDQIAAGPNTGGNAGTALDPVTMESVTVAPAEPTAAPATAAPATAAPASTEPTAAPAS